MLQGRGCGKAWVSVCMHVPLPSPPRLHTQPPALCCSCEGEGEACTPITGRACRRSACVEATGAVTTVECAGFCTTGAAPSLVSAALTNDGRQILLRFDAAVYATSYSPRLGCQLG